ncbi:MAG: hypothetical protein GX620_11230 [Chloroflexi bacterium]|nr:hypothetical protein [Chloroflexota bacterium]
MPASVGAGWSSHDRLMSAMRGEEPDHVPMWQLWRNRDVPFTYATQSERVEAVLSLGIDDTLLLQPPLNKTEHYDVNRILGVEITVRRVQDETERYPLLVKEYDTPDGVMRQVVRETEDWPYGPDVRLFSDHNVSRSKEFPVKGPDDLPRLRHLLCEPTADLMAEFEGVATSLRQDARRLNVVLEGGWTALGDAALWLLGTEALLMLQMDQPDFVGELLDVVCEWEMRRMTYLLDAGAEVIVHSAWYESTDFWTPRNYRRLLKPRLKRMVDLAHEAGALFSYICTASWQALMDDFIDLGFDSLMGVDPVQGSADLQVTKERLGRHMCLWGGINGALTLGHGAPEEVCAATREAVRVLGPGGGFVLYAVDQVVTETPWSNVESMIECWRDVARYPVG